MTQFQKKSMDELNRLDAVDLKHAEHFPIIIILDNVRSMNNVGSTFRTGDAFNVEKIILGGITPTPPHREIQKTALGATESVNWSHELDLIDYIKSIKEKGYTVIAIEQVHNSISLNEWKPLSSEKIAVVFGNEVEGVSEDVILACDKCIEIPQFGSKHSLNISVTTGIILWHYINNCQI